MKVYLSGAISNDPDHKRKFEQAREKYMAKGYIVLSPIDTKEYQTKRSNCECFFASIKLMKDADIMIQLDNPEKSKGMQIEQQIADYCNITVIEEYKK